MGAGCTHEGRTHEGRPHEGRPHEGRTHESRAHQVRRYFVGRKLNKFLKKILLHSFWLDPGSGMGKNPDSG